MHDRSESDGSEDIVLNNEKKGVLEKKLEEYKKRIQNIRDESSEAFHNFAENPQNALDALGGIDNIFKKMLGDNYDEYKKDLAKIAPPKNLEEVAAYVSADIIRDEEVACMQDAKYKHLILLTLLNEGRISMQKISDLLIDAEGDEINVTALANAYGVIQIYNDGEGTTIGGTGLPE